MMMKICVHFPDTKRWEMGGILRESKTSSELDIDWMGHVTCDSRLPVLHSIHWLTDGRALDSEAFVGEAVAPTMTAMQA